MSLPPQYVFQPAMLDPGHGIDRVEEGVAIFTRHTIIEWDYIVLSGWVLCVGGGGSLVPSPYFPFDFHSDGMEIGAGCEGRVDGWVVAGGGPVPCRYMSLHLCGVCVCV